MVRKLLICGLIAGAIAGIIGMGFASVAGEPAIDEAIAFEEAALSPAELAEPAAVSRDAQKGFGLLTATLAYGLAFGGIFAVAFAVIYGRVARIKPAWTALLLAGAAFVVMFLVPFLKYPANPPAVGDPGTIDRRTVLYVTMITISLLAAISAVRLAKSQWKRRGQGPALAIGLATYIGVVVVAGLALPSVSEIPKDFPATTLWEFRQANVGLQLIMWTLIGGVFAATAPRVMEGESPFWWFKRLRGAATAPASD